ncbi:MAG: response regulator, partial [Bacteroidota bacterium]
MEKIKCIIVEDEPWALDLLKGYVERIPFLELLGAFFNPIEALYFIQEKKVELLFLDINMPDLNGFELSNLLSRQSMIIFTTAYSEYALESYNHQAIDYLLKPIEWDRFLTACNKTLE